MPWFLFSALAGVVAGLIFFGGLWLTVRQLHRVSSPALWMLGSVVLRFSILLGSLFLVMRWGGVVHVLIALAGVIAVRMMLANRLAPAPENHGSLQP